MSSNKQIIQIGTKMYSFPRLKYETDKSYFIRKKFFMRISPKSEEQYIEAINMSITWVNMKLLKCIYKQDVIENINKVLS